jgi:L-threonylcarbamoyladenylate synthase
LAIEEIEHLTGKVKLQIQDSSNPVAPGQLKSHYAPRKKLVFNDPAQIKTGANVAVIAFDNYLQEVPEEKQILLSPKGDLNEAAKNLFAAMRQCDAGDSDFIYAVKFPEVGLGRAINDRLKRASA